ncbi:CsbD family protein [Pseudanabaena sp. BC1403]|uniref:CsbD family protein n=1 Tax=Pseudanabaena sp. BC1403 TaxID=2043171 RepID=UPI000CD814BA|nr:CsbD family protein [Pseudanabaena sp. BC1403]
MSLENRAKAVAKNVEGKVQETVGDLTGNKKDQMQGNAKQVEANVRNAAEDVKDKVKKAVD